jgi:hypothetical protein
MLARQPHVETVNIVQSARIWLSVAITHAMIAAPRMPATKISVFAVSRRRMTESDSPGPRPVNWLAATTPRKTLGNQSNRMQMG